MIYLILELEVTERERSKDQRVWPVIKLLIFISHCNNIEIQGTGCPLKKTRGIKNDRYTTGKRFQEQGQKKGP